MSELQDIIDILISKRESLLDEKTQELESVIKTINEKYVIREEKINKLLKECGYCEEETQCKMVDIERQQNSIASSPNAVDTLNQTFSDQE